MAHSANGCYAVLLIIGLLSKPTEQQEGPDLMETLTTFVENGAVFIFKNCYIFMNIAMMVG